MFTGIIEEKGSIRGFEKSAAGWRLDVAAHLATEDLASGDSIAVNGCCLTASAFSPEHIEFDVLVETKRLTNLEYLRAGASVNLERSLRFHGKVGGHFVTGHVDGLGTVETFERRGDDHYLRVAYPPSGRATVVPKGSIAIDGVSLTVAEVDDAHLAVWLIPTTLKLTRLGELRPGDLLNLEFDLLGKYVEKMARMGALT